MILLKHLPVDTDVVVHFLSKLFYTFSDSTFMILKFTISTIYLYVLQSNHRSGIYIVH